MQKLCNAVTMTEGCSLWLIELGSGLKKEGSQKLSS